MPSERGRKPVRLSLFSSVNDLDPAPRRFLYFTAFNVISWQCIVGPAMVLFARAINMPASYVGFLISFMPLSSLIVAVTMPLIVFFGPKRMLFFAWMSRNLAVCSVFLLPWAVRNWGERAGWCVLGGSVLAFCILRAMGSGCWFPWLHEVVPGNQRGSYFSAESAITQLINVGIILGQGLLLHFDPGVRSYLSIYAVGISAGLFSLIWMSRVPGGEAVPDMPTVWSSFAAYGKPLRDGNYLRFLAISSLSFSAMSWLGSSMVLYLRDAMGINDNIIMVYIAAASVAVLLTIRHWGRFADEAGSARAMSKTLFAHSLGALACLAATPTSPIAIYLLVPVLVGMTMYGAAFAMAANRAVLNLTCEQGRIGYTNLWTLATALAMGLTPIAVGLVIDAGGLWGFRICFLIAGVAGLVFAIGCRYFVVEDPADARPPVLNALANPGLPLRMVGRVIWISLGLHDSARVNGSSKAQVDGSARPPHAGAPPTGTPSPGDSCTHRASA